MWTCPAHDDRTPSLSVGQTTNGAKPGAMIKCHADCSTEDVLAALGLRFEHLFDDYDLARKRRDSATVEYHYIDEGGNLLYQVLRKPGKKFTQRRPDGEGGWIYNLKGVAPVLYRLPEAAEAVAAGDTVYIVEGEKDVEAIRGAGGVGTCNSGGAGTWKAAHAEYLRGATVVIVADKDAPGRKHAAQVEDVLKDVAASVTVMEPVQGKDAHDALVKHGLSLEQAFEAPVRDAQEPEDQHRSGPGQPTVGNVPGPGCEPGAEVVWAELEPFGEATPEEFPVGALPPWLRDYVEALAETTQTPIDLPAVIALAACCTAVAGKVEIEQKPGHIEPLNLYVAVALPPGSRKTAVFSRISYSIQAFERELARVAEPMIAEEREQMKVLSERLKKLRRDAAKASGEEREEFEEECRQIAKEIDERERDATHFPRLTTDDVTPEKLAVLIQDQGGRMAVWSPEGGEVFELMRGRYSANGRGNIGIFLKGHAGDQLRVDRVSAPPVTVERPCLTLALCVQPSVIELLREEGAFRDRGLCGRFLYSMPVSRLGKRSWRTGPIPDSVDEAYRGSLRKLLRLEAQQLTLPGGPAKTSSTAAPPSKPGAAPWTLGLSPEAREALTLLGEEIEPELGEFGRLAWISDWAGKLPGAVARIAGILHCAIHAGVGRPANTPVSLDTMQSAIEIGRYFLSHASIAFTSMGGDPAELAARKVWRALQKSGRSEMSERDIFQKVKGGRIESMDDLREALKVIEERGYIARGPKPQQGAGRPRSTSWRINPAALATEPFGGIGGESE